MKRYIDADKLQKEFKELHGGKRSLLIDTEQTADVVEVVRCKDCIYWRDTDHTCKHSFTSPRCANDYCSYGERGKYEKNN